MRDDDIERLIDEIEKRPALYLKSMKEYSDINLKKKLWEEVSLVMANDWNTLGPDEKIKQGAAFQKKWHNLRSCFTRELRAQQTTKSGQAESKRRKYIYFDRLFFLLPDMEQRQTESNLSPSEDDEEVNDGETSDLEDDPLNQPINYPPRTKSKKKESYEKQLLKVLKEKKSDQAPIDEETNFALSLLPTLKSLPEENKLQAGIEILGVLRRMKFCQPPYISSPPPKDYQQRNIQPSTSSNFNQSKRDYNLMDPNTTSLNYDAQQSRNYLHQNNVTSPSRHVFDKSAKSYYSEFSSDLTENNTSITNL